MQRVRFCFSLVFLLIAMAGCSPKYESLRTVETPVTYSPQPNYVPSPDPFFVTQGRRPDVQPRVYETIKQKQLLVVIDPGHGGEDEGTTSPFQKAAHEKYANLTTAKLLQTYLQQMGFRTLMTRDKDIFLSLPARSQYANQQNADIYVSVHYNSAPAPSAHGIEVFYFNSPESKGRTASSKELAKEVLAKVIAATGAKSRGIKHGNLAVIRETKMPAVLIEGGFFTNEAEFNKIKDLNYIKKIALGIAQGVQEYSQKKIQS